MAPPFALPASHFAVALGFWVAGALTLVWAAPEVARGGFASPRVVALTHLFTLGWITTTIMGALYQFLPVALGAPIRWTRLAWATLAVFAPGLALFTAGLLAARSAWVIVGAVVFGVALMMFVANLAATLWGARPRGDEPDAAERRLTWYALALAAAFLAATVLLGAALSGNLRWGFLGAERFVALGVHMHVAIAGWVLLVIVGVAHRLLPMFLLSHGASGVTGCAAVGLLGGGSGLLLVLTTRSPRWSGRPRAARRPGRSRSCSRRRSSSGTGGSRRSTPAAPRGLRLAFLLALAIAPFAVHAGLAAPRLATAYVLVLVLGGLSLFVAGHYYKILPFLVWYHRFGPLVGRGRCRAWRTCTPPARHAAAALLGRRRRSASAAATLLGPDRLARPAAAAVRRRRRRSSRRRCGPSPEGGPDEPPLAGVPARPPRGWTSRRRRRRRRRRGSRDRHRRGSGPALGTVIDPGDRARHRHARAGLRGGGRGRAVRVTFTLTTPGCPMEEVITQGIVTRSRACRASST
jgi:hypothetical protein